MKHQSGAARIVETRFLPNAAVPNGRSKPCAVSGVGTEEVLKLRSYGPSDEDIDRCIEEMEITRIQETPLLALAVERDIAAVLLRDTGAEDSVDCSRETVRPPHRPPSDNDNQRSAKNQIGSSPSEQSSGSMSRATVRPPRLVAVAPAPTPPLRKQVMVPPPSVPGAASEELCVTRRMPALQRPPKADEVIELELEDLLPEDPDQGLALMLCRASEPVEAAEPALPVVPALEVGSQSRRPRAPVRSIEPATAAKTPPWAGVALCVAAAGALTLYGLAPSSSSPMPVSAAAVVAVSPPALPAVAQHAAPTGAGSSGATTAPPPAIETATLPAAPQEPKPRLFGRLVPVRVTPPATEPAAVGPPAVAPPATEPAAVGPPAVTPPAAVPVLKPAIAKSPSLSGRVVGNEED
jgi:hypothetical protein